MVSPLNWVRGVGQLPHQKELPSAQCGFHAWPLDLVVLEGKSKDAQGNQGEQERLQNVA